MFSLLTWPLPLIPRPFLTVKAFYSQAFPTNSKFSSVEKKISNFVFPTWVTGDNYRTKDWEDSWHCDYLDLEEKMCTLSVGKLKELLLGAS